ncbi:MAG: biosynthetic-type acetolactate synthase large subunit [Methanomassiliicoccales archaeon]|nr:biosynthetic-type acetolactate synthase large subunit [Methanomassiliicoccales archaeon]NYT16291.1 biosynthetic-type acetolactate synthase large subunit [Methanomassiliicoccales archaeon]
MRGAEILVNVLRDEGVNVLFGYPGGAMLPLYDHLSESDMRHVLVRHEQCAAHMADGYARVTKRPAVCMATSGAGATNLVTGIATAFLDSSPVIALTGQVPTSIIGNDAFQEADIFSLMMPITKHNFRVMNPQLLENDLRSAFKIAGSGRYGPVQVDLPKDILNAEIDPLPGRQPLRANGMKKDLSRLPDAVNLLRKAERPLIVVGGGGIWCGCGQDVMELAEMTMSPVVTTLMGKSAVPENHPLVLGMVGMHGRRVANWALEECDVLLAIGTRFSDRMIGDPSSCRTKVIHLDIDSGELGKNVTATIPLAGDARTVIRQMIMAMAKKTGPTPWANRVGELKERCNCDFNIMDSPIKPQKVIHELNTILPDDAIITTEVGQCQMWAAHFLRCDGDRRFITPGGLGTMGFGLPAAIGAKVAAPDRAVVDVAGDGSLMMVCQEIVTAVKEDIPIFICLLNNQRLGMIMQLQNQFYDGRLFAEQLGAFPDFVKLAEAFGAKGARVDDPSDLSSVIEEGITSDKPFLADIRIDTEEQILPMTIRGQAETKVIQGKCAWKGVS